MRPEKISMIAEVRGQLEKSPFLLLTNTRGLTVEQMSDLRRKLRATHARLQVVRNSAVAVAARELGWGDGLNSILQGPTAMITGTGDASEAVKILKGFIKDNNNLPGIKGGMLAGQVLTVADVEAVASLPSREVMLAMFLGTLNAPMGQLVGALNQKLCTLLYALKAIEEKKSSEVAASKE